MPTKKKVSFETNLKKLDIIVTSLENGDVPLDQALNQFKKGVKLSQQLQKKLSSAETTLAKMVKQNGQEVPYDRDQNGHDVNNQVDGNKEAK